MTAAKKKPGKKATPELWTQDYLMLKVGRNEGFAEGLEAAAQLVEDHLFRVLAAKIRKLKVNP